LVFVDERLFSEAAQPEALEKSNSIAVESRGLSRPAQRRVRILALEGTARHAPGASPAGLRQRSHDVISYMELRDIRTHCSYDPRNLVTKHRWRRDNFVSCKQQVGVAQARRLHIDENFAFYRRGYLNVLEIEPTTDRV
jgi:hypothetical protein